MVFRAALVTVLAVSTAALFGVPSAHARGEKRLEKVAQKQINILRAQNGLRRLRRSPSLTRSAEAYAGYMLRNGYFGHLSTIQASRRYRSLGEVILKHRGLYGRPKVAVNRWARSAAHRYLLLSGNYRQVGIAKASGRLGGRRVTIWVAHVGRR